MSDGFQVSLSALTGLAGTFDSRQQGFRSLGGPLRQSAAAVRTGDAALDSEIQNVVGHCDAVFGQMADALGQFADGLRANAQNYQDVDSQTAQSLQALMPDDAVDSPLVG
jgi:uncharacterized protein YukE